MTTVAPLNALDAAFLELEEADPTAHMHIGTAMIFTGEPPDLDTVARHLDERLGALPLYRCRLSQRRTHGLSWPEWVEAPAFDIHHHLARAALPAPGAERELLAWLGDYWSHRLDRTRPLWEAVLLEGLADDRWAIVTKTHHCMIDGVASADAAQLLLDAEPEAPAWHAPPTEAVAQDGDRHRVRDAAAALVHLVAHSRSLAELVVRDELVGAPHTSLNRAIGERRRIGVFRAELEELRRVKGELGGTINDVVLTVVAGGLRRLLLERGEAPPPAGLRAMVPVSTRPQDHALAAGNRVTSLFVNLPVAEPDPLERHALTLAAAESLKQGGQAGAGSALVEAGGLLPPVLHATLARSLFATRLFNFTVTNVPGPRDRLYALGRPMTEVLGLVPLAAEHAIGIAVVSYAGAVTFTVNADYESVPDLDVLVRGLQLSLGELAAAGRVPAALP